MNSANKKQFQVDRLWIGEFQERMHTFAAARAPKPHETAISIKVRASAGCFHREHSPQAFLAMDDYLAKNPIQKDAVALVEHESGPELLSFIGAGMSLAAGILACVAAIIDARNKGIAKGDRPSEPLELIVRRVDESGRLLEKTVLNVQAGSKARREALAAVLEPGIRHLLARPSKAQVAKKKANSAVQRTRKKSRAANHRR